MQADVRHIVFAAKGRAICATGPETLTPPSDGVVIEVHYSCISAGTELAKLLGRQPFDYPSRIGNRAVGRVVEVGPRCRGMQPGDLVFSHASHASHALGAMLTARLPEELDQPAAALLGMALVAFGGVRVAAAEMGDVAVVTGAGLVGQFTAQLLRESGVTPVLVDPMAGRLEIARAAGVDTVVNAAEQDAFEAVMNLTAGRGAEHVLECTGVPAVVERAIGYCAQSGQLTLVGSPRGEHPADLTSFLNNVHIWKPHGDVTIKGAHEWKIPISPSPGGKHSQERNLRILADLMLAGRLKTEPLLTHVVAPEDCQQVYDGLAHDAENHLGVVFDWTKN